MTAGILAAKLIVRPKDITTATPVRQVAGGSSSGGGDPSDPGDFGDFGEGPVPPGEATPETEQEVPTGWELIPGREAFSVFCHEETAREQIAAGKDTASTTYVLWCLLGTGGEPPVAEDEYLEVEGEGRLNLTGVVRRPTDGLCRVDAQRVG